MESDVLDVPNAPNATATTTIAEGHEYEALSQTGQIVRQLGTETERSQSVNLGVLKATSGNAAKWLRMRQEARVTAKAGKPAEAAIKQIATQELQAEKERMQEWEQIVMQAIIQAQEEAVKAQRHGLQMEIEGVKEKLHQVELQSTTLENQIKALKTQKQAPGQRPTQDTPSTGKISKVSSSTRLIEGIKATDPLRKSYAQIAASSSAKNATEKA